MLSSESTGISKAKRFIGGNQHRTSRKNFSKDRKLLSIESLPSTYNLSERSGTMKFENLIQRIDAFARCEAPRIDTFSGSSPSSLPSISTILNNEKIRFSILAEIDRCLQLDYCKQFNQRLYIIFEKLKCCLLTGCVSTLFAFEFMRLITKKQLTTYASLGMKPEALRMVSHLVMAGQIRPSMVFELMHKNVLKLFKSNTYDSRQVNW